MSVQEKMTAIADAIREKTGGTDALTMDGMAAAIPAVHAAGAKSEYDRFWDAYQENGNRYGYSHAFAGVAWTKDIFQPKYDICPQNALQMFRTATQLNFDLDEHLSGLGIEFDTSHCINFSETFMDSAVTGLGTIDTRSASSVAYIFRGARSLVTVRHLILKDDGTQTVSVQAFQNCSALENIRVSGVIGQSDLSLQWSTKLSHDSIVSIIHALSASTAGLSVTLSETAVNNAFTAEEWEALIATKPNWTINLV